MSMVLLVPVLWLVSQVYFRIAENYNIIDKPNERSSHNKPTIRGGGVLFLAGLLYWYFASGMPNSLLVAGVMFIGIISFIDDIKTLPASVRLLGHIVSFVLVTLELNLADSIPLPGIILIFVVGIGALNAFNFMDGINGITGIYALVCLVTFAYIDRSMVKFTDDGMMIALILSVIVFLVYNFRPVARCFAGDVGSVTIAFSLIYITLQLMIATQSYGWFVVFSIYAVDAISTIIYRLMKKENIFKAHRSHLYQYLANEMKFSHLSVSLIYGVLQLLINVLVLTLFRFPTLMQGVIITLMIALIYLVIRERILYKLKVRGLISFFSDRK